MIAHVKTKDLKAALAALGSAHCFRLKAAGRTLSIAAGERMETIPAEVWSEGEVSTGTFPAFPPEEYVEIYAALRFAGAWRRVVVFYPYTPHHRRDYQPVYEFLTC